MQFLREQSYQGHLQTVNITRATLCELGMQFSESLCVFFLHVLTLKPSSG
jgi:hypothetical protein